MNFPRESHGFFVHHHQQWCSTRLFNAWLETQAAFFYLCFSPHTWGKLFFSEMLQKGNGSKGLQFMDQNSQLLCPKNKTETSAEGEPITATVKWYLFTQLIYYHCQHYYVAGMPSKGESCRVEMLCWFPLRRCGVRVLPDNRSMAQFPLRYIASTRKAAAGVLK